LRDFSRSVTLESLLVSTGVVALAEMGDKTQLLALMLAARYRARLPIVAGIALATLANHALASAFGAWLAQAVGEQVLRWGLAISFFAMAAWMLVPDKADEAAASRPRFGVFGTTFIAFFIVEMGDKTQIATVALAAHYGSFMWVLLGTTLGMLIANVPAVYAGEALLRRVPVRLLQRIAAATFAVLGVLALLA
jgi:putative Ca2+/H+ antiporter (TMEM165/GDT1 family)